MKKSISAGNFIKREVNDTFVTTGINLGLRQVKKLSNGIINIQKCFGIDSSLQGIDKITCTKFPKPFIKKVRIKNKKGLLVVFLQEVDILKNLKLKELLKWFRLNPDNNENLMTSWDEDSFAILALEENVNYLYDILKMWANKDISIVLLRKNNNEASLNIIQRSIFNENLIEEMLNNDLNQND